MTDLGPEGQPLFDAWRAAVDAEQHAFTSTDMDETARREEEAWDAWSDWVSTNSRCQQCGEPLADAWPFANCFEHSDTGQQAEWAAYVKTGTWAS